MPFKPGNKQWKKRKTVGRPRRATEEKYLSLIGKTVTAEDWVKVVMTALARAKAGDSRARDFLAQYLIGKPTEYVNVDQDTAVDITLTWGDENTDNAADSAPSTADGEGSSG